jgi:anti-sigma regulatory factor (Ser/Thr protein kinase)
VGRARDFTESALSEWGWNAPDWSDADAHERTEDILLVVSELVANAMTHGGGVQELALMVEDGTLVVGVTDSGPGQPTPLPGGDPSRPGGHGLHVVELLSERWGTTQQASGKTVWARFTL